MAKICYYGDKISEHISKTPEGFLICQSVPIARTGFQQYLDSELDDHGDPDEIVNVFRSPEEVFSRATLASFEGKPVCNGHPDVDVTPENYSDLACGHVQHVRIGTGEDADKILADLYITDPVLIDEITNGKREVSAGYYAEDDKDKYGRICQINIRGNHVAVVDKGRAGRSVCIRDSQSKRGEEMRLSRLRKLRRYLTDADPEDLAARVDKVSEILEDEGVDVDMIDEDGSEIISDDILEDEDILEDVFDDEDEDIFGDEDIDGLDEIEVKDEDIFENDLLADEDMEDEDVIDDPMKSDEDVFENSEILEDEDIEGDDIFSEESDIVTDCNKKDDDPNEVEEDAIIDDEFKKPVCDAAFKQLAKVARKISNRHDRAMMQDAIIKARGCKSQMPGLVKATRDAKARRDASYVSMNISKQQSIYDALNPHKQH